MAKSEVCVVVGEGQIDEDFYWDLRVNVGKEVKNLDVKRDGDIVKLCGDIDSLNHFKNLVDNERDVEIKKSHHADFMILELASLKEKIERAMFSNR